MFHDALSDSGDLPFHLKLLLLPSEDCMRSTEEENVNMTNKEVVEEIEDRSFPGKTLVKRGQIGFDLYIQDHHRQVGSPPVPHGRTYL